MNILIDAGHGGEDCGAINNGRKESDDNLKLSLDVGKRLQEHSINISYTRQVDNYVSLQDRCNKEKSNSYDLFISFHRNSFNSQAYGIEAFTYNMYGKAYDVSIQLLKNLSEYFYNRGVKDGKSLYVINSTRCEALLLETGFIDNINDNKKFDQFYKEIVESIVKGILKVYNIEYINPNYSKPQEDKLYRVCVGAFKDYNNATKQKELAESKGLSAYIV